MPRPECHVNRVRSFGKPFERNPDNYMTYRPMLYGYKMIYVTISNHYEVKIIFIAVVWTVMDIIFGESVHYTSQPP